MRIAVENLFGPPLERPEQMTEILQNLNSEQFTGCLDVGHSMYSGIKPQDFLRSVPRGLITVLHIQDQQLGKRQDLHFSSVGLKATSEPPNRKFNKRTVLI